MLRSFYFKLVLFGCLLCTLPVLFIGTFSYVSSTRQVQVHVERGQLLLLRQTAISVEQILKTLDHSLNQVVNASLMSEVLTSPLDVYNFQIYNEFRAELSYLQSFDIKVADVIVLNTKMNWYMKNSGLYRLDEVPQREALTAQLELPANSSWQLYPSSLFYNKETDYSGCSYHLSLVKKLPARSFEKTGLIFANIPVCRIADMIPGDAASKTTMILDADHRILVHSDPSWIGRSVMETGYLDDPDKLSAASGQYEITVGSRRYSVNHIRSDYNGWTYLSVISLDELRRDSKTIGWLTFAVCLLILAVCLVLVWLGSRRMYSPIHRLIHTWGGRLPGTSDKKINEFQLIDQQLHQLFRSKTALEQQMHRHLQQVLIFTLIRLYNGELKTQEIAARMEDFGLHERIGAWRSMTVLTLQIDTLRNTAYTSRDIDLLLFAISNIVEELIPESRRLPVIVMEQTQVTLIGDPGDAAAAGETGKPSGDRFKDDLYTITESIQQTVRKLLNLQVSIGVSLPFTSIGDAPRAYREGVEALRQRIKLGDGVIIEYAELNRGHHPCRFDYPDRIEHELLDAVKLADEDKAAELLRELLHTVIETGDSPQDLQIPLIRLLNNLLIMMREAGIDLREIRGSGSPYEELLALGTFGEIEEWYRNGMIRPMITVFRERRDSQYQRLSEQIIKMIRQGFDTDLTLEACAAKLHYNVNYLSGVFRKETQMTFSEYLTRYRFSMAKKWLAETDMPIKEIAERLQYNNPQNFIRSFRRQEGVTPGHYRKQFGR
jgi:AraC-like DNA-binding protein